VFSRGDISRLGPKAITGVVGYVDLSSGFWNRDAWGGVELGESVWDRAFWRLVILTFGSNGDDDAI
jgi:hypothetical protein